MSSSNRTLRRAVYKEIRQNKLYRNVTSSINLPVFAEIVIGSRIVFSVVPGHGAGQISHTGQAGHEGVRHLKLFPKNPKYCRSDGKPIT